MKAPELFWLPLEQDVEGRLAALKAAVGGGSGDRSAAWREVERLARVRLDFTQVGRLDRAVQRLLAAGEAPGNLQRVRVALLTSATVQHVMASLRVAGLRRGMLLEIYTNAYGQYFQEVLDAGSELHAFRPQVCCVALDARHVAELAGEGEDAALERLRTCWRVCKEQFGAAVVQATALPVLEDLLGSNELRLVGSPAARLRRVNAAVAAECEASGVALFDAARMAEMVGMDALHDAALWHMAKQEVHPAAAPVWADALVRVVAAVQGRSAKCLVLDLDNTLWGGVVGDDGVEGLKLGVGHAAGEAFVAFQQYCAGLKARGVALAVCSKNDEANARAPFREHAAMVLREEDVACFVANWEDKAANLRAIAKRMNLGLDALVFVDDNPAERVLVRTELPEVQVPEMPEDPAGFVRCLARAGYFEGVCCTAEDRARAGQYRANEEREALRESATDLGAYLESLRMRAVWREWDEAGLERVVQLVNKTNQFNLTTPRMSAEEVRGWMGDSCRRTWQVRLEDRFGDNGVVALMAARVCGGSCELEMLLMSCRVLGRGLEDVLMNLLADAAREAGAGMVRGVYKPTAKNGMVRELLGRFGFQRVGENEDGSAEWELAMSEFEPLATKILVGQQAVAAFAEGRK